MTDVNMPAETAAALAHPLAAPAPAPAPAAEQAKVPAKNTRQGVCRTPIHGVPETYPSIRQAAADLDLPISLIRRLIDTGEFYRNGDRFSFVTLEKASAVQKKVSVAIHEDLHADLEKLAGESGRTISLFMRDIVHEWSIAKGLMARAA